MAINSAGVRLDLSMLRRLERQQSHNSLRLSAVIPDSVKASYLLDMLGSSLGHVLFLKH